MLAVQPNANVATPSAVAPSSPLGAVVNNATDANGAPVFAQVVRDALNRTTNNTASQPAPATKTTDAAATSQAPLASSSTVSHLAGVPDLLKPPNKTPGQKPSNDSQSAGTLLTALLANFSPELSQQAVGDSAPAGAAITENESVSPTAAQDSDKQTAQVSVGGNSAILFGAQLPLQLASQLQTQPQVLSPASLEALTSDPANAGAVPKPEKGSAIQPPVASTEQATGVEAISAALAAAANPAVATTAGLTAPVQSAVAAPSPALETGINAQVSATSLNPAQGQLLSSVLQQIADLSGPATNHLPVSSVAVDLEHSATQSPFVPAAANSALTSSSLSHTSSATAGALASSEVKGTQSASLETHPAAPAQNAASAGNNPADRQDSSSNHGGQNPSEASVSTDPGLAAAVQAKAQNSTFSDTLSSALILKPEVAPAPQTASTVVPATATSIPPSDFPTRTAADSVPQAPAPPPPPPGQQLPDAPSGRFVNDAQLTNAASQSEMRIAMQTDKLGAVELHARVSGDEVGAAILVEKRDAHAALAVELPALQQALSDKQLRVDQVSLTQGSLSSTAGDAGANAQNGQRGTSQPPRQTPFWNEERSLSTAAWFVPEQTGIFNAQGRLSVQA